MRRVYLSIFLSLFVVLLAGCGRASLSTPARDSSPTSTEVVPTLGDIDIAQVRAQSGNFTLGEVLAKTDTYTRYFITYQNGEYTISGIMNIPNGEGPFPVAILNHGHIPTAIYTNGRGLRREQDYLASREFAVIHPDYRNHAQSSKDARDEISVRLGYIEDVLSAVYAVQQANIPTLDTERIGMLGHSMGGGITLSVLTLDPSLVDAAVLYAPVSGDTVKSYERWMRGRNTVGDITALYGDPTRSDTSDTVRQFWDSVSADTFYDRVQTPVHIFHGTNDADVPLAWSDETYHALQTEGVSVEYTVYDGEAHEFGPKWNDFMEKTVSFFQSQGM